MILSCQEITKAFGENIIIDRGSFHIEDHEKAALIGLNGAGKSTILKMIAGELACDSGQIIIGSGVTLGYLSQYQELTKGNSIYSEVRQAKAPIIRMEEEIRRTEKELKDLKGEALEAKLRSYHHLVSAFEQADGYAYESEITGVLKGLGFEREDFDKNVETLSGGQKTRTALGKLLLTRPDILLLDEPTNHLDLNSIRWLENYLLNYKGAVLIVSHDRYFLNRVVTKVIEIEASKITQYSGNYTAFAEKKQIIRQNRIKEYINQQREIKHQEAVITKLKSFNREKSIKRAESREKLLARLERIEKPLEIHTDMHLTLAPSITSGNDVLTVDSLGKSFGNRCLFSDVSFSIKRGEHVAIIGDNGTGKTTLLKILNQVIPPDEGEFILGTNVHIGYYDQEHHVLHSDKTIFDEISDDYPTLSGTQIRNTLAAFLFTGDEVFKQISSLSGGERGRLSLAKLMLSRANFLILDEPTNHLDIASKEILENALKHYTGTVLYVSHDRYFINQTASRILELTGNTFVNYIGNYDYYLEKREDLTAAYTQVDENANTQTIQSASKVTWQRQKEEQARIRKRKNDLNRLEEAISQLEERDAQIDISLTDPEVYTDPEQCQKLSVEKKEISEKLENLYVEWEALAE